MLDLRKNQELKERYEKIFSGQPRSFFTFNPINDSIAIYHITSWQDKKVLEIGCEEGHLANLLAVAGADVTAIDYAASAIKSY